MRGGLGVVCYQPVMVGPGMTSVHGLSESKGRSRSYANINDGNERTGGETA